MSARGVRVRFTAAGRHLAAALVLLVAAASVVARAEQGAGNSAPATGHDEAAGRSDGPSKATPANGAPAEHGSDAAPRARTSSPTDAVERTPHAGAPHTGPHPGAGTKDGAADAPAIDARPSLGHRITTRPIRELLPTPFHAPSPAMHVRHPPAFAIGAPARNAIGIPLDHPPITKPIAPAPPASGANPAAKSANGGVAGRAGPTTLLRQDIAPPIPSVPRNAGLNGTAISRVGTGPATVGGAARFTTGINGTSIRPKHGN